MALLSFVTFITGCLRYEMKVTCSLQASGWPSGWEGRGFLFHYVGEIGITVVGVHPALSGRAEHYGKREVPPPPLEPRSQPSAGARVSVNRF